MKSLIEDDKLFIENGPTNIIAEVFSSDKKEIYNLIVEKGKKYKLSNCGCGEGILMEDWD